MNLEYAHTTEMLGNLKDNENTLHYPVMSHYLNQQDLNILLNNSN